MRKWDRPRRLAMTIGIVGIILEVIAIALLVTDRVSTTIGLPLVIAGMFVALVPSFVLARSARR